MKKFSAVFLSLVLLLVGFISGCTKADNATLISVKEKYDYIISNNEEIFDENTNLFNPQYNVSGLQEAINNGATIDLKNLKSHSDLRNLDGNNAYGILYRAINSTFFSTDAFNVANNKLTEKQYKKNMYVALENLQSDCKKLNTTKIALESLFDNNTKSYLVIAGEQTTQYNLEKYIINLNNCLYDLYDFNNNYNLALKNNIFKSIELDDLLYKSTNVKVSYFENKNLINTCNLLISNYVLNYSISLKENMAENETLIENLRTILSLQMSLNSEEISDSDMVENYKLLRMMESTLLDEEVNFNQVCKNLSPEKINSDDEKFDFDKNFINSYSNKLIDYSNKLINYLTAINKN